MTPGFPSTSTSNLKRKAPGDEDQPSAGVRWHPPPVSSVPMFSTAAGHAPLPTTSLPMSYSGFTPSNPATRSSAPLFQLLPRKSDSHRVLATLLDHNPSPPIHTSLAERAEEKLSPAEVEELLSLLRKLGMAVEHATSRVKDGEKFHCARCHETYRERHNTGSSCCIMHEVCNEEGKRRWGDILYYTCKSCGRMGIETRGGDGIDWPDNGVCYEGLHTSEPDGVDYDDYNTLPCDWVGCPGSEKLHCVRCHETYTELDRTGFGCYIDHHANRHPERFEDTYRYICSSCGETGIKEGGAKDIRWYHGWCYEGRHTVNVEDVIYDGKNTLTCASSGCHGGEEH